MPIQLDPKKDRALIAKLAGETPAVAAQDGPAATKHASRGERTGFSVLIAKGWNVEYDALLRIRLWRGPMDTGFHATERAACDTARALAAQNQEVTA